MQALMQDMRDKDEHIKKYRFKKGQSGNPSGRPRKIQSKLPEIIIAFIQLISKVEQKDSSALDMLEKIKNILF
jgi:hypothetical protein